MAAQATLAEAEEELTPKGAADLMGVTTHRVRQLLKASRLEFRWTPFGRLISRESVERHIAARQMRRSAGGAHAA